MTALHCFQRQWKRCINDVWLIKNIWNSTKPNFINILLFRSIFTNKNVNLGSKNFFEKMDIYKCPKMKSMTFGSQRVFQNILFQINIKWHWLCFYKIFIWNCDYFIFLEQRHLFRQSRFLLLFVVKIKTANI